MVRCGVRGGELIRHCFLQFVDENQGADFEITCRLSESFEERRQVIGEAPRVGDTLYRLHVDTEADILRRVYS